MEPTAVVPGRSLGPVYLGASLHEILTVIKERKAAYPVIDLHHSSTRPLHVPVVVALPQNGLRLRFDAADQRLRLIEVMDFSKIKLAYKGSELVKNGDDSMMSARPGFRRVYQIFGASYPGEYHPPKDRGIKFGSYVLSWTGIAFTFPLEHSVYGPQKDHVSMLGSSAASSATQMALFEGNSWPEARQDLFVRTPTGPRLSALAQRPRDNLPAEIEYASIGGGDGTITLIRKPPAPPFIITLNETTPQDLVTELGPPDATHKRDSSPAMPQQTTHHRRTSSVSRPFANGRSHAGSQPSSYSSTGTDTFDADFDSADGGDDATDPADRRTRETFWCYFHHGLDILVGPPTNTSSAASPHLTATKVVLHANVPGSYAFNRHRRLRWTLALPRTPWVTDLDSEANFPGTLKPALLDAFRGARPESEMARGKVINRTWGDSAAAGDSAFFLPDETGEGEEVVEGQGSEQWLGNTKIFSFPGLAVEVLENGFVGSLSVWA